METPFFTWLSVVAVFLLSLVAAEAVGQSKLPGAIPADLQAKIKAKEGLTERTNIKNMVPYVIVDGSETQRMPPLERLILFMKGAFPLGDGN